MNQIKQSIASVTFLSLGLLGAGCATENSAEDAVEQVESGEDALGAKPVYRLTTLKAQGLLGSYVEDAKLAGKVAGKGNPVDHWLTDAKLITVGAQTYLDFGSSGKARVYQSGNSLLFSSGTTMQYKNGDGCQDPQCMDVVKISGVISPVARGNKWVPQIKMSAQVEYFYPIGEEDEAKAGTYTVVTRFNKR